MISLLAGDLSKGEATALREWVGPLRAAAAARRLHGIDQFTGRRR
jgi:hypothetical protein